MIALDRILSDEDPDDDAVERIEALIEAEGWLAVRQALMAVLEDPTRPAEAWATVAAVFWGAVLDRREIAVDRLIALVYTRLPPDEGSGESNLAWSIASKLRGVD